MKQKLFIFCFCIFFIVLFCGLGIWQLHRYHTKQMLLSHYQQNQHAVPVLVTSLSHFTAFQAVAAKGEYHPGLTLFLQNRYYHGQLGIDILTPFKIRGDDKWILVDRGWVKATYHQTVAVDRIVGEQKIAGFVKLFNEPQFILGNNILKQTPTEIVLQKIDIKELNKLTHLTFYPFVFLLGPAQSYGFTRDWTIATGLPQRHMAYAIQWFTMAFVLLIAFMVVLYRWDRE